MHKILMSSSALLLVLSLNAQTKKSVKPTVKQNSAVAGNTKLIPVLNTFNDSVSYAMGLSLAKFYQQQGAKGINTKLLSHAINAVFAKDSVLLTNNQIAAVLMAADQHYSAEKSAGAKKEGAAFLAKNKTKPGVITLPDGLQYEVLEKGTGAAPTDTSNVKVHYKGSLLDGTEFDNSYKRGEPIDLNVNEVIKGWTEALPLMHEGAKWRLYVPSDLGYGDRGAGQTIPAGSTLIFDIELIKVNH
ncbi:MAG TPA: FKBP-type peptidyl-prolyl cis-trans isomerase [Arachidicoccus sp.]|nr:FKBP-type peptidyl-prolyl cis-trans isomerase [Arachidicoccus sp.]